MKITNFYHFCFKKNINEILDTTRTRGRKCPVLSFYVTRPNYNNDNEEN
jgi:hypothetical protein